MPRNDRGDSAVLITLLVALVLAGLIVCYALWQHRTPSRPPFASPGRPALGAEQRAYFESLKFTDPRMSAAQNFLGDTVTYLDASVTNKGARNIHRLDVELNFVDILNQVVLRETAHPLARGARPLKPGETRAFRVTFEHLPVDWNHAPPRITPVFLEF